jgi:predicted HNH restriction endonuclease
VICGENKIVSVHHYDENHNNNSIENLIPLCPTHHQYIHSKYKDEILNKVDEYRNYFISLIKNNGM